jgi:hypothetical protein
LNIERAQSNDFNDYMYGRITLDEFKSRGGDERDIDGNYSND